MTPYRRLSQVITATGATLALIVMLVAAGDLYRRYRETIADAERRTAILTQVAGEHVARTFETIDRVLKLSADAFEEFARGPALPGDVAQERIGAIHSGSAMLLGLSWIARDGRRIAGTATVQSTRTAGAADPLTAHQQNPRLGLHVSQTMRAGPMSPSQINVSRRVESRDGNFLGIVDGVLNIDYFLATYSKLDPSVGSVVGVFHLNGTALICSEGQAAYGGRSAAGSPLFAALEKAPAGTVEAESPFDRQVRILSYCAVPDLPLVVTVSFIKSEVLGPWFASLAVTGGLLLLTVVALLTGTAWLRALAAANERTQRDLAAANKRVDAASRTKSDFLATMSHELRTPMTGIIGYSDLLYAAAGDPKLKDYARIVSASSRALLSILDGILDLSAIESGRLTLRVGPLDPVEIVNDALAVIAQLALDKDVTTELHVGKSVPRALLGDRDRLRQVVANLLGNAVKFTDRGRIDVAIERVGTTEAGETIQISVTDTGIGIPKDAQSLLFQRFSQVDNSVSRRFGGTGLGLAISKHLVELMGGRIGVESAPGRGSTFWFTVVLPAAPEAAAAPEPEGDGERTGRVLMVDDNISNLALVAAMLDAVGHKVDTAANGKVAVARVAETDYDVVLMDVNMPIMDGLEATARIRAMENPKSRVPIVALTAASTPEEADRCIKAGMDGHIGKPVDVELLLSTVADLIRPAPAAAG